MQNHKDKFEEYYVAVPDDGEEQSGSGRRMVYRYSGPWYYWNRTPEELKKTKWRIGAAGILDGILFFLTSVLYIDINLMSRMKTLALLSLLALIYEELGIVQFCMQKEQMMKPDFENIATKLKLITPLRAVLLLLAVFVGGNYLLRESFRALSLVMLLGYALCAALSLFVFGTYKSLRFRVEKNTLLDQLEARREKAKERQ